MLMRNKILAFIIAITFVFSVPIVIGATGNLYVQTLQLENGIMYSGTREGNAEIASVDALHPKALKVYTDNENRKNSAAYFFVQEAAECEATLISFDLYMENESIRSYVQLYDQTATSEQSAAVAYGTLQTMQNQNKILYFTKPVGGTTSMFGLDAKLLGLDSIAGQWLKVNIWADFHLGRMIYYINGVLLAEVPMPESLKQIGGFRYAVANQGVAGTHYIDNVNIYNISDISGFNGISDEKIPDYMGKEVIILPDNKSNNLGYIYYDTNFNLKVGVENMTDAPKKVTLGYTVKDSSGSARDENGIPICSKTDYLNIGANTRQDRTLSIEVSKYGLYTLGITLWPQTESGTDYNSPIYQTSIDFSVANVSRDGVKNDWIGIADHTDSTMQGNGSDEAARKIKLLADAGFSEIRSEYWLKSYKQSDNTIGVPAGTLQLQELVKANGMKFMGILAGTPAEINSDAWWVPTTDAELALWKEYVTYAARQSTDYTKYYEVWNEYNAPAFNVNNATPQQYVNLLKASYEGVKAGNPKGVVCGFVAANIGDKGSDAENYDISALEWMEEVLKAGGGEYMDAASIHGYTHVNPEGANANRTWLIDETRALLDKYGYTDMPIIMSEMGWSSGWKSDKAEDELVRAKWMIRYCAMRYGTVDKLYWYVSQAKGKMNGEDDFGLLRGWERNMTEGHTPYSAKATFLAAANFNTLMADAKLEEKCSTGTNSIYNYRFKDRNNRTVNIVWSLTNKTAEISTTISDPIVYDIYGNTVEYTRTAQGVTLALTDSPVYITEKPKPVEVYADYNTERVTVKGSLDVSSSMIGITVTDKEAAKLTPTDIIYAGQGKTDAYGKYTFTFKNLADSGTYNVKIGYSGGTNTEELKWALDIPRLLVKGSNGRITSISQMEVGEAITATVENSAALNGGDNTSLIIVQYSNGAIEEVTMAKPTVGEENPTATAALKENTDKIKVLFWENVKNSPLIGAYEIK